ncbi:MAG: hypothetical protein IT359_15440 [Gemmatimonadaceae bacterium]|nr:hypothetical protein [Gemmatimonadaceae bacterium]
MPGKPEKQHRIRVKTLDGKPRDQSAINKLKSNQLGMPHLDIVGTAVATEFIICASKDTHIELVRAKLQAVGLEAIDSGDTVIAAAAAPKPAQPQPRQGALQQPRGDSYHQGGGQRGGAPHGRQAVPANNAQPLPGKPYGFVSLPKDLKTSTPIWHDGTSSKERLSGELRFEFKTLTPLLAGWERGLVGESESDWPVPANLEGTQLANKKSVLCPLRAPWGKRPVIIPGDSLKGLLRHELGALLGAPMERVAERSYSYRPNALFPNQPNPKLIARIARVPNNGIEMKALDDKTKVRVPTKLELLPTNLRYDKRHDQGANYYRFDDGRGAAYRGGQGAGVRLNSKRNLHSELTANPALPTHTATLSQEVQESYLATVRHLVDEATGHFSERHPDAKEYGAKATARIRDAARSVVFQPGDFVWVEWDTENCCIVSLGWHYYYRWAYTDSVRKTRGQIERFGLFPLDEEREKDGNGAPKALSAVRRIFGYTGDNEGSAGIGENDHAQLMGRIFVNAGLEVVGDNDSDDERFLKPTFLKELGMPRPSAVEHYLKQPHHPHSRPSDKATLATYGDAAGYDAPGDLAGRKFYLDRKDAYEGAPWVDDSNTNKQNDRSTLALEASKPGRTFRFTVRFRDLEAAELAAIAVALCPDQFKAVLDGTHTEGYCSKLGYARPLGWGSVRIEAKQLLLLDEAGEVPTLRPKGDLAAWVKNNHQKLSTQDQWVAIHRRNHPEAADYPCKDGAIYTFHTSLRAEHSRNRRYKNGRSP